MSGEEVDTAELREFAEMNLYDGDNDHPHAGYEELISAADEIGRLRAARQADEAKITAGLEMIETMIGWDYGDLTNFALERVREALAAER